MSALLFYLIAFILWSLNIIPPPTEILIFLENLYNNYGLYYIGKADTSLRSRISKHKRSKKKKWNKYSWYQTKNYTHAKELERILLRLVNPPDNKIQSRGIGKRKRERLLIK